MPDPYRIINWAWIAVLIIWLASSLTSKRTVRRQSTGSRLLQLCLGLLAGLLIWGNGPWRVLAGWQVVARSPGGASVALVLTLAGLAFALWARFVIGRNWSGAVTLKQDHELIQAGPYRLVRHPIYSGFLLALLGTAIARGTVGAFAGEAIAVLTFRLKAKTEESFMSEQFGSQYGEYRCRVKGLIPFLW